MMGGFGLRIVAQAVYFVLLARTLGPEEYGAFVGVLALVILLAPFASWGSGNILIKHVSRFPEQFPTYWGAALATTLVSGGGLVVFAVGLSGLFFGWERALALALPLAIGEMLGTRLGDVASQAFQALHQMKRTSAIWAGMTFSRLLGLILFLFFPGEKVASLWAWFYAASGVGLGVLAVFWVGRKLGWGPLSLVPMRGEWREGFYFAVSLSSQGAYNDIDKTLLSRLVSDQVAGIYGAAYRIIDASFIPVRALLFASYPRFFEAGAKGLGWAGRLAVRLLQIALLLALLTSFFLVIGTPLVSKLLGQSFVGVREVIFWLLPLVFLRVMHYFPADALTGSGFQGLRTAFQIGVAVLNVGLNLWLIPLWGWKGAAAASWLSDGLLALSLWGGLGYMLAKAKIKAQQV